MSTLPERIGKPDGAHFLHRRLGEGQHDIEIVNHQVEHDVDIERARSEDAQPVHFEKHWLGEDGNGRANGGIEALEMSDLGNAFCAGGASVTSSSASSSVAASGFSIEHIDAGLHQLLAPQQDDAPWEPLRMRPAPRCAW